MRCLALLAEAELVTSRKRASCVGTVSMLSRGVAGPALGWRGRGRLRVGPHPPAAPGGRLVRFSFRAVGAIDPAIIEDIESVWTALVASRLKALAETGSAEGALAAESNLRAIGEPRARPAGSGPRRRKGSAGKPVTNARDHERR
jgi:hypothetical protein